MSIIEGMLPIVGAGSNVILTSSPSLTAGVLSSGSCQERDYYKTGRKEGEGRKGSISRIMGLIGSHSKRLVP